MEPKLDPSSEFFTALFPGHVYGLHDCYQRYPSCPSDYRPVAVKSRNTWSSASLDSISYLLTTRKVYKGRFWLEEFILKHKRSTILTWLPEDDSFLKANQESGCLFPPPGRGSRHTDTHIHTTTKLTKPHGHQQNNLR